MEERLSSGRLVGRERELALLRERYETACAAVPAAVAIGGEAGCGRSRLLEEFLTSLADDRPLVLHGVCYDGGDLPVPFAPLAEAFRGVAGVTGALAAAGEAGSRAQLFERLLTDLEELGRERTVVLALEDLQLADRSTLDLLAFLVSNLRAARTLVLLTWCSERLPGSRDLRHYVNQLARGAGVTRLELGPLPRTALDELLAEAAGGPIERPVEEAIWQRSGGNPSYALELLAAARARGPGDGPDPLPNSLADLMLDRLEALSSSAGHVVRIAAAGGRRIDHRLLAAVAGLPPTELFAALREAVEHSVLVPADNGEEYRFRHAVLQEVAYRQLLPGERQHVHAGYAAAVAGVELPGGPAVVAAELAYHHQLAGEFGPALEASLRAARLAVHGHGFVEGASHYERALALWDRVEQAARPDVDHPALLAEAAEADHLAGRHSAAVDRARQALQAAGPADAETRCRLTERLGRYLAAAAELDEALLSYESAANLPPASTSTELAATVHGGFARVLADATRYRDARREALAAVAAARAAGARREEGRARATLGAVLVALDEPDEGTATLREALAIAEEVGDPDTIAQGYRQLVAALAGPLARLDEAAEEARRGVARVDGLGLGRSHGVTLRALMVDALFRAGRWTEADPVLAEALERTASGAAALDLRLAQVKLSIGRGQFDEAHADLRRIASAAARTDVRVRVPLETLEAGLALWEGRLDDARSAVGRGLVWLSNSEDLAVTGPLLWHGLRTEAEQAERARAHRDHAALAAALGQARGFRERSAALRSTGPRQGALLSLVEVYDCMCEGEYGRVVGTPDPQTWARVAEAWDRIGQPYPAAYARLRRAAALLAAPQGAGPASEPLRQAHATALRLGAKPLRTDIERLARFAGIDLTPSPPAGSARGQTSPAVPNGTAGSGPDGPGGRRPVGAAEEGGGRRGLPARLTPRELEVLVLVASGATNRQIARDLFISEKTAGVHVSNILAKLGAHSRTAAAATAHRLGVLG